MLCCQSRYCRFPSRSLHSFHGSYVYDNSFADCWCLSMITLESGSTLISIPPSAFSVGMFAPFSNLYFSSVGELCQSCFLLCHSLSAFTFEPASKLCYFGYGAFQPCVKLRSIWIPSSVQSLGSSCSQQCTSISLITPESGSQLSGIGESRFLSADPFYQFLFLPPLQCLSPAVSLNLVLFPTSHFSRVLTETPCLFSMPSTFVSLHSFFGCHARQDLFQLLYLPFTHHIRTMF